MTTASYHKGDISAFTFLVTGGAGFIGSHLVDYLIQHNAKVRVLDNFSTGNIQNIEHLLDNPNLQLIEGDITELAICRLACNGVDYVLHQAALGSVPRSVDNPLATNNANVNGFLNILESSRHEKVKKVVFASSSSVYGDSKALPKQESIIGRPLSPYAVSKLVDELYAQVFSDIYGMDITGLRYFNIFGPRQNPEGPYAAAIPLFIKAALDNKSVSVFGDGEQTRDFTYVENAVKANMCAVFSKESKGAIYNIAAGTRVSLNKIIDFISELSGSRIQVEYKSPRAGDVKDSHADISKATTDLCYKPEIPVMDGLSRTYNWFASKSQAAE